ncbi:MAG: cyclophilin-like fold protein [Thermodesulfobacteriota bacterium]|nr:cyclophilin-like fold protein [Thermodesulfobacteriota bacterium]
MERKIIIEAGEVTGKAVLFESEIAKEIWDLLPIESTCNTWGDEIYFTIAVSRSLDETAKEVVVMGELGYWPTGKALCIFFGPTPMSRGDEIRPASPVNIVGKVISEPKMFSKVFTGTKVTVKKAG